MTRTRSATEVGPDGAAGLISAADAPSIDVCTWRIVRTLGCSWEMIQCSIGSTRRGSASHPGGIDRSMVSRDGLVALDEQHVVPDLAQV